MAVETVIDNIKFAAREPFKEGLIGPLKGGFPGFKPVELLRHILPELKAVLQRPLVKGLVVVKTF